MKISITIPQLFYDLIGRIVPGFLFLFVLHQILDGTELSLELTSSIFFAKEAIGVFGALGYSIILCYFTGWILRFVCLPDLQKDIDKKHPPESGLSIEDRYKMIKLCHPESGFRLVKLLAETHMLMAARSAFMLSVAVTLFVLVLGYYNMIDTTNVQPLLWFLRLTIPIILIFPVAIAEKRIWELYNDNVKYLYKIVVEEAFNKEYIPGMKSPNKQ